MTDMDIYYLEKFSEDQFSPFTSQKLIKYYSDWRFRCDIKLNIYF